MRQFAGIYPAIVTAFNDHGEFDPSAMRRIVQHQMAAGVDGFYLCGGTGEGMLLTVPERQAVLETVLDEVAGRAGAKRLYLTHLSARYSANATPLEREAREVFPKAEVAYDGLTLELTYDTNAAGSRR